MTLVEVIIVCVILAILSAVISQVFGTAKRTSEFKAATAAAQSYKQGVSAFMLDHGNRPPVVGAATTPPEWPAPAERGPLDRYGKAYMRGGPPEAVNNRSTTFAANTPLSNGSNKYAIVYRVSGTAGYSIQVFKRKKPSDPFPATASCTLGNLGAEKC